MLKTHLNNSFAQPDYIQLVLILLIQDKFFSYAYLTNFIQEENFSNINSNFVFLPSSVFNNEFYGHRLPLIQKICIILHMMPYWLGNQIVEFNLPSKYNALCAIPDYGNTVSYICLKFQGFAFYLLQNHGAICPK